MRTYSVLLIDDDEDFASLTHDSLEQYHLDVTVKTDISNVLTDELDDLVETHDCVLCDYNMPDYTGIDVLKAVRNIDADIPFLLYTGEGSEEIAERAIQNGVTEYVRKRGTQNHFVVLANRIKSLIDSPTPNETEFDISDPRVINNIQKIFNNSVDITEKIDNLLEFGVKYFNTEGGFIAKVDDQFMMLQGENMIEIIGESAYEPCDAELSFCQYTTQLEGTLVIEDAEKEGFAEHPGFTESGVQSYIGSTVYVDGTLFGTLCFVGSEPHEFTDADKVFIGVLSRWVSYELTQHVNSQKLEVKNKQLSEFVDLLSHDLKTPLTTAKGYAELLRDDLPPEKQGEAQQIIDSVNQINTIINEFKVLIESIGKLTQEQKERVTLDEQVQDCWDSLNHTNSTLQVTVKSDIGNTLFGNRGLLRQMFLNIFENALDHNLEPVTVSVVIDEDTIIIEDDGVGLDTPEQVFDKDYSTTDGGYGLYLVERILDLHNWEITAMNSSETGGAKFIIHHASSDALEEITTSSE